MPTPTPISSKIPITPRYSDCQAGGTLHPTAFVRAMLHAALQAGAAQDSNEADLEAASWLERVGSLGLQIFEPALFADVLEIETRLTRKGQAAWRRAFTFKRGAVSLAEGFIDTFSDVSDGLRTEDPAGAWPQDRTAWDEALPELPELPPKPFRGNWTVGWSNQDLSGQLDPAALMQLIGDMETRACEERGWTEVYNRENGFTWQMVEFRLELYSAIGPGDELNIVTFLGEVGDNEIVRQTLIERDYDEVAGSRTRWACVNPETGARCDIPNAWLGDLAVQMAEE